MSTVLSQPVTPFKGPIVAGLAGGVIAAAVNAMIFWVAQLVNGGPLIVQAAPLTLFSVLVSSLIPGPAAGVFYGALARFTRTPTRWFLIAAVVVFALAVVAALPFITQSDWAAVWTLELIHVGAAVPIVWTILTLGRQVSR